MTQRWMLTSERDYDEGQGVICPDQITGPSVYVLRCEGGAQYSADSLSTPCGCGKPCAAVVKGLPTD